MTQHGYGDRRKNSNWNEDAIWFCDGCSRKPSKPHSAHCPNCCGFTTPTRQAELMRMKKKARDANKT